MPRAYSLWGSFLDGWKTVNERYSEYSAGRRTFFTRKTFVYDNGEARRHRRRSRGRRGRSPAPGCRQGRWQVPSRSSYDPPRRFARKSTTGWGKVYFELRFRRPGRNCACASRQRAREESSSSAWSEAKTRSYDKEYDRGYSFPYQDDRSRKRNREDFSSEDDWSFSGESSAEDSEDPLEEDLDGFEERWDPGTNQGYPKYSDRTRYSYHGSGGYRGSNSYESSSTDSCDDRESTDSDTDDGEPSGAFGTGQYAEHRYKGSDSAKDTDHCRSKNGHKGYGQKKPNANRYQGTGGSDARSEGTSYDRYPKEDKSSGKNSYDEHPRRPPPADRSGSGRSNGFPGRASKQVLNGRSHYGILQVSPEADQATLNKAAKLARIKAHPDKNLRSSMSVKEKQTIHENAAKVGQAADILTDPRKRTQYDLQIGIHKH